MQPVLACFSPFEQDTLIISIPDKAATGVGWSTLRVPE
jgi:hypothetical protein